MAPYHGELEVIKGKIHLTNGQNSSVVDISGDLVVSVRQSGDCIIIKPASNAAIDPDRMEIPATTERNDNSRAQHRELSIESSIWVGGNNARNNDDDDELEAIETKQSGAPRTSLNALITPIVQVPGLRSLTSSTIEGDLAIEYCADVTRKFPPWSAPTQVALAKSKTKFMLCQMPLLREVTVLRKEPEYHDQKLLGYLVQSRGTMDSQLCFNCDRQAGPFAGFQCVSLYGDNLKVGKGACEACIWGGNYKSCSYHDNHSLKSFKGDTLKHARKAKNKIDRIKLTMGREVLQEEEEEDDDNE